MFVIDLQNMISLEGAHVPFFFLVIHTKTS